MKKIIFIISHLGSGSSELVKSLNKNPRCVFYESKNVYDHPDAFDLLLRYHKLMNLSCAIYGDHILYNQSIVHDKFLEKLKFIYIIRSPKDALQSIHENYKYNYKNAYNYYRFRLRRMCEMANKTKNFLFFTYDELFDKNNLNKINNYLNLIEPIDMIKKEEKEDFNFYNKSFSLAQDCYEKYFYYLNNLRNKR